MTLCNQTAPCGTEAIAYDNAAQIIELDGFAVFRLKRQTQLIRVLSGCAWITLAGEDIFVPRGQEILLPAGRECLIISSPNSRPLVFEIVEG